MDSLERIFELQSELSRRMPKRGDTRGERVANLCTAQIHEVVELQRLTNWKWWKLPVEFDIIDARDELADILHFTIQLALELDMKPADMLAAYERKNAVNHKRLNDGY